MDTINTGVFHYLFYKMKLEGRYHRFVQWSDEDQCYIGYCPDLYFGGVCHSENESKAYGELRTIISDEVAHRLAEGQTLPSSDPGQEITGFVTI